MSERLSPEDIKPDERHRDLELIHDAIWFGIKLLAVTVIPLMLTGIGALVAGYFQEQQIVEKQTEMAAHFVKLDGRLEDMVLKVEIMWHSGRFDGSTIKGSSNHLPNGWPGNQPALANYERVF